MTDRANESAGELRRRSEEQLRAKESPPGLAGPAATPETPSPGEIQRLLHELRVHQIELEMQNVELCRAQQELETVRARYFDLYDLAPVGYLTLSEQGMIREANLAAAAMFGLAKSMLIKQPFNRFIVREDQDVYYRQLKLRFESSAPQVWEMSLARADGSAFLAHLQATPARGGEFWVTFDDMTERKQAEKEKTALLEQIQQARKLESLGVLAGGIAHDFNNILAIIMGYCSLVKMDHGTAQSHIPQIEKAVDRAAGLCRQMLAYAGKAPSFATQVDMTVLMTEMVNMLKWDINQNVAIKADFPEDIPFIKADDGQIRQIVMNLITNSAEAIGELKGEIRVSLEKIKISEGEEDKDHLGRSISPGGYLCLEVTDNGCGMDEETRQRIFEPFYTTKFAGRGLGMSAVLGIILAHRGALKLASQPGLGTTIKVYLPVETGEPAGDASLLPRSAPLPWQGSGTILLAEDEEEVRLVAAAMLESLGFTVIEASNGREALDLYRKHAGRISLVLTDMGMPVMDGYELHCALKRFNPVLPIIFSSGYGDTLITSRIAREDIAGVLSKPYSFDQLLNVLKSVMEDVYAETHEKAPY